jgi:hypothetical protein|tara:strand:+ start:375 stop:539 length:165 start_codon:yes stop_codon:yes gene_type:complete
MERLFAGDLTDMDKDIKGMDSLETEAFLIEALQYLCPASLTQQASSRGTFTHVL